MQIGNEVALIVVDSVLQLKFHVIIKAMFPLIHRIICRKKYGDCQTENSISVPGIVERGTLPNFRKQCSFKHIKIFEQGIFSSHVVANFATTKS